MPNHLLWHLSGAITPFSNRGNGDARLCSYDNSDGESYGYGYGFGNGAGTGDGNG